MMETSPEIVIGKLTKEDITAFKTADDICLYHVDGKGLIRLSLHNSCGKRIYTAREQRLFTPDRFGHERERKIITDSRVRGYHSYGVAPWNSDNTPTVYAWYSPISLRSNDIWPSLVSWLRVGDALSLVWYADNNNDHHKKVGFHRDEVYLVITRGKTCMRFMVGVEVGPDNSARMIQRNPR